MYNGILWDLKNKNVAFFICTDIKPLVLSKVSVHGVNILLKKKKSRRKIRGGTDIDRHTCIYMSFSEMIHKEQGTVIDSGNGKQATKEQVSGNFFLWHF